VRSFAPWPGQPLGLRSIFKLNVATGGDALYVVENALMVSNRALIVTLALKKQLPMTSPFSRHSPNGVRVGRKGAPIWLLRQGLGRVRRDTVAPSLPLFARAQISGVGQLGMRPPGRSLEQLHFLGHQQRAEL
jgi:hypothetical protein